MSKKTSYVNKQNVQDLNPQTDVNFKKTVRHYFKRRTALVDRPVIVINFQGVLGDFFKDSGIYQNSDLTRGNQNKQNVSLAV